MDTSEEIRTAEYLFHAAPETCYEWLKAWPKKAPSYYFNGNNIPELIEQKLLSRKDEIIDLALAAWGTNSETIETIYKRWCARSASTDWPPQRYSYQYAILASLVANLNASSLIFKFSDAGETTADDFGWLIENCDKDRFELLELMHANEGVGYGLLLRLAKKSGAYNRIDDDRWLRCLGILGNNKSLHRIETSNAADGPDLLHWSIHESLVRAAIACPKTCDGASVIGGVFQWLPTTASTGAYIKDELLSEAVLAWNVEILCDDESNFWLKIYHKSDALTPSERVQFHLLRHYHSPFELNPDDSVRVVRLAAYACSPVNGGKRWGNRSTGQGLDAASFQKYSERDGPAFMYANSFNPHIWRDDTVSKPLKPYRNDNKLTYPEDPGEIFDNREAITNAVEDDALGMADSVESEPGDEVKTGATIANLREELDQARKTLDARISNLKKWLIWGVVVIVILILNRH